jgi:hypothetical protein
VKPSELVAALTAAHEAGLITGLGLVGFTDDKGQPVYGFMVASEVAELWQEEAKS